MFPILLKLGPITIYTYGFFLALAVFFGIFVIWREATKLGFQEEKFIDLVVLGLIVAIVGSRFFHLVIYGGLNIPNLLRFWQGARDWYGGLFLTLIFLYYYSKRCGWSLFEVGDILALGVSLALVIESIGCILSGCDLLSSTIYGLFYFLLFLALKFSLKRKLLFAGSNLFSFLILSSFFRFIIKSESFSFVVVLVSVVGLYKRWLDYRGVAKLSLLDEFKAKSLLKRGDPRTWREKRMQKISIHSEFLRKIKSKLLRQEEQLNQQEMLLGEEDPFAQKDRVEDSAERVSDTEEQIGHERISAIRKLLVASRDRVKAALLRIRKGRYGVCEKCGNSIDPARLEADPTARLCLVCRRRQETLKTSP